MQICNLVVEILCPIAIQSLLQTLMVIKSHNQTPQKPCCTSTRGVVIIMLVLYFTYLDFKKWPGFIITKWVHLPPASCPSSAADLMQRVWNQGIANQKLRASCHTSRDLDTSIKGCKLHVIATLKSVILELLLKSSQHKLFGIVYIKDFTNF